MYIKSKIEYIKAITPIHAGVGQELGIADMPIQREKHSNIPKIEASSLKGSIKSFLYRKNRDKNDGDELFKIFGPKEGETASSLIGFTDAKLLLFPIKSATDIYKLITCPYILNRWIEDLMLGEKKLDDENHVNIPKGNWKVEDGKVISLAPKESCIILEEYVFEEEKIEDEDKKDIKGLFKKIQDVNLNKILILSDSDFIEMVTMYTEIITRNKIDMDKGVADKTGLFTEEYLPMESILYFIILETGKFKADIENPENEEKSVAIEYYKKNIGKVFQIGANLTIGKGFVKRLDINEKGGENHV